MENSPDELFASPLRSDRRPLDGIFHATFVSARMHYALAKSVTSGALNVREVSFATERLQAATSAFNEGRATLVQHARLTSLGKQALRAADDYMQRVR